MIRTELSTFPPIPHPVASGPKKVDSGKTLALPTPSRRRERALSEAEAYARCHGHRALCPVRVTGGGDSEDSVQAAMKRVLRELRL
jgi:hypothetical protein